MGFISVDFDVTDQIVCILLHIGLKMEA